MRLAFLADIHGNLPALEAVIADLRAVAPDGVYLLGDQINRLPWNNEVLDLGAAERWPAIYGNHEWIISRIGTPECPPAFAQRSRFPGMWWAAETLTPRNLSAIRMLPAELLLNFYPAPPLRILHATPGNPFVGFLPEHSDPQLAALAGGVRESVVITAHTHREMDRTITAHGGQLLRLLNGGSVGLPYDGDPRAHYLFVTLVRTGDVWSWEPAFRRVAYDYAALRPAYERSGLLAASGAVAELHLRTALTGQPYSSDFGHWLREQSHEVRNDMEVAVPLYLTAHGPGRWAFPLTFE